MDASCDKRERVFLDFETYPIDIETNTPPKPVGLAIKVAGKDPEYLAFGHLSGNNSTHDEAYQRLKTYYEGNYIMCFHNAVFDLNVAKYHFNLPIPEPTQWDDTMLLAFIVNPEWPRFGLKELCQSLLKLPPTERDDLKEHIKVTLKEQKTPCKDKDLLSCIYAASGDAVADYAKGDVVRTEKLFNWLWPKLDMRVKIKKGYIPCPWGKILKAYNREKRVSIILGEMRYAGLRVDIPALERDLEKVNAVLSSIEDYFVNLIGEKINFKSSKQVLHHFFRLDLLDKDKLLKTDKGQYSTSADSMNLALKNKEVAAVYKLQGSLTTMRATYMQNWIRIAKKNNGYVFCDWKLAAQRTGRIGSKPNFQNIPNEYAINELFNLDGSNPKLPDYPLKSEPFAPAMRSYILPYKEGHKLIGIDYSQQEIRLLAHYENKVLLQQYKDNPNTNMHKYVSEVMTKKFKPIDKDTAKTLNFSILYGAGPWKVSQQLGITEAEAVELLGVHSKLFPNIYRVKQILTNKVLKGLPFYTIGGRRYFGKTNKWGELDLKTPPNTLMQGSGSDLTKSAAIVFWYLKHPETVMQMLIHDEIEISTPEELAESEEKKLTYIMEKVATLGCRTPLLTESHIADNLAGCK